MPKNKVRFANCFCSNLLGMPAVTVCVQRSEVGALGLSVAVV
jgi:hypothetical protein